MLIYPAPVILYKRCRVFRQRGVETSRNCPRRHKISTPHGWRVVNIQNKQHYYYDSFEPPTTRIFSGGFSFAQRKKKQGGIRMKKHFIMAGILATSIIQPATAVTKCVALNSNTTCTQEYPGDNVSDWTSTCTTNGVSTPIKGIGICSADKGNAVGSTATVLRISATLDENANCWCRMISPAVSRWVFSNTHSPAEICPQACSDYCTGKIWNDAAFRSAMFGSLSD